MAENMTDKDRALGHLVRATTYVDRAAERLEVLEESQCRAMHRAHAAGVSIRRIAEVVGATYPTAHRMIRAFEDRHEPWEVETTQRPGSRGFAKPARPGSRGRRASGRSKRRNR